MKPGRVVALVIGCLVAIPALGLLIGGSGLGLAHAFGRGDDGYFDATLDRLDTPTVAITADDLTFATDPGSPDWLLDSLDADVRFRVTNVDAERDVFVGVARQNDVDAYLDGVAHDVVTELDGSTAVFSPRSGGDVVASPTDQAFWVASATGPGLQELNWEATSGRWAAVVMNADGGPGVVADLNVGVKAEFLLPLALILLGVGVALTAVAVALIVFGATGKKGEPTETLGDRIAATDEPIGEVFDGGPDDRRHPVVLSAALDPDLSRWKWLVKWLLAIPHVIVLAFLWIAFVILTMVAGFAILFTGRYPRSIFDFNVGVMRWSWRVSYYATTGGIGTDRYPPFSLEPNAAYPAELAVAYPEHLSRGLVLVKWWLLAIPQYLVVGLLVGGSLSLATGGSDRVRFDGGGLLGVFVLIAGVVLLFRGRYPRPLFDLIVGLNRWIYRVVAYAALMTDQYPPFRLDQGGADPAARPRPPRHPAATDSVDPPAPSPDSGTERVSA